MFGRLMELSLCVVIMGFAVAVEAGQYQHYTVKDSPRPAYENYQFSVQDSLEIMAGATTEILDLLNFKPHMGSMPVPRERYDRERHFGSWLPVEGCRNTRQLVLERDSQVPVQWSGCRVSSGQWLDPYSGKKIRTSKSIEIDHFVALKNAYLSGAWTWSSKARCIYSNFMGNTSHLKAVSRDENQKKSDLTPADYIPSNQAYTCRYLREWLYVKLIWQLKLTDDEVAAIQDLAKEKGCDSNNFVVDLSEIREQRDLVIDSDINCAD